MPLYTGKDRRFLFKSGGPSVTSNHYVTVLC